MSNPLETVEMTAFDANRLRAIEKYALLELNLVGLVEFLLGIDFNNAVAIFYRMTNTRSRYALIDDLLSQSRHRDFRKFWRSFERKQGQIDQTRNGIVHWISIAHHENPNIGHVGGSAGGDGELTDKYLIPGQRFGKPFDTKITLDDMKEFQDEVGTQTFLLGYFISTVKGTLPPSQRDALREIYLRPINDQTLGDLQKALIPKGWKRQPPSSPP
jgi:hypothetical protein